MIIKSSNKVRIKRSIKRITMGPPLLTWVNYALYCPTWVDVL
jgi:hypothetical protein